MQLLELIREEIKGKRINIVLAAAVSGLSSAGVLVVINHVTQAAPESNSSFYYVALFIIMLAMYIYCFRYTLNTTALIFQNMVHGIRRTVSDKIRKADLITLEGVGKSRIYGLLTQETTLLTQSAQMLSAGLQAALMVIFASIYIAFLSLIAFVATVVVVFLGISIFMSRRRDTFQQLEVTSQKEVVFIESVSHLLDGFKEVKMNVQRSDAVYRHIDEVAGTVKASSLKSSFLQHEQYIFAHYFFYVLIAVIVFLLPRFFSTYDDVVAEITTAILFVIGPLSTVVGSLNVLTRVNQAANRIRRLEDELEGHLAPVADGDEGVPEAMPSFSEITLVHSKFSYVEEGGQKAFSVGPVSFSITPGEILFIIGGNGSGKSTLLKLITALYYPDQGALLVDGTAVDRGNVQPYRGLFSAIFSDFHLFDQLYGLPAVDAARVNELLRQMQLDQTTQFVDNRFTNLDLSTGQRKRLALVVALLEDRPIYVFDELAADQDPTFRKYLYREVLPALKKQGKTIIAVTHDDKYFHVADRIMKMDYGQIEFIVTPDEFDQRGGV